MRRLLAPALLLGASLLVSGLLAEGALRWMLGSPLPFKYPQATYEHDPEIGHWLAPDQEAFAHDNVLRTNSVGIRGLDLPREPSPGTLRILATGDSQTFGNGLPLEETWPAQLERELGRSAGRRVEVVNGGLPGTDTWQHVYMLRRLSRAYSFDAVVLGFYVNDVVPRWAPPAAAERTNTWSKRIGYVLKRSALFSLIWQSYQNAFSSTAVREREQNILTGAPDDAVDRGWAQVEASLGEMKAYTEELGVPLMLVVIPRRDQVSGLQVGTSYNEEIARIAAKLGIPSIDVLPELQEAHRSVGSRLFIPWDGHNTGLANAVIAERLAPTVAAAVAGE